jgi:predicted enzyme related to lactoylglutathione lyase
MERWTKDFDNWGVCDTLCFKLYDRSPHAWKKLAPWARRKDEFVRRAAFALLASLALHDKAAKDEAFVLTLPLIEKAAADDRNFVRKGVSWALRSVGRRNAALRARSVGAGETSRRVRRSGPALDRQGRVARAHPMKEDKAMTARQPGEFCWINLLTPEPEEAKEFFAGVLGWTYGEIPGMGWSILADGGAVGGLFDTAGPNSPPGTKPQLGVMVKVENADAAVARFNAHGGKATPAWDVGPNGRMAVCHDPNGAPIDVWQPLGKPGTEVGPRDYGRPDLVRDRDHRRRSRRALLPGRLRLDARVDADGRQRLHGVQARRRVRRRDGGAGRRPALGNLLHRRRCRRRGPRGDQPRRDRAAGGPRRAERRSLGQPDLAPGRAVLGPAVRLADPIILAVPSCSLPAA